MQTIIHWFRRDLRISDNTALYEAWKRGECLVPVFVWEEAVLQAPDLGAARLTFLLRSLEALAKNLDALGHRLIVRRGAAVVELIKLAREVKASAVVTNRDYEPAAIARDRLVATELYQAGIYFESFKDLVVWEGREILTKVGDPYTVFTPYSKAWRARAVPAPVPRLGRAKVPLSNAAYSEPLPADSAAWERPLRQTLEPAGEQAAQATLKAFVQRRVFDYHQTRNFPADDSGTSRLSPHLRAGTVGIRTVVAKLRQAVEIVPPAQRRGAEVWESELIWREFYLQILANFPHVATGSFRPEYDALGWSGTDLQFEAWCTGQTGFPIVDAAMRCLNATGWMHNRLRMIVAMFLTKDLLISWQRGERFFMRQLVDGDLAANNGGWQWSAGTGTDAAPYFRIFNPVSQGEKFDPEGVFVRRWLPELAEVGTARIHRPWEEPGLPKQRKYPLPIVDHAQQRGRCLAMFQAVKA
ncbi:MAG TPA: deoxyribodipyrimidine photo-lyase [Verrucomicrobiota bacterium]|nr:deoxyribodipyrimidine photo-lyase [Verrucomicrobiota bacterium]